MAAEAIVLDNSVNSRLLWPDVESPANNRYARKVIRRAARGGELHVPTIWHYEAANVVATLVRKGHVSRASAMSYLRALAALPIRTDTTSHTNATAATFALSAELGLSVYDAAYVELALRLSSALATNDKQLRDAARKAGAALFD